MTEKNQQINMEYCSLNTKYCSVNTKYCSVNTKLVQVLYLLSLARIVCCSWRQLVLLRIDWLLTSGVAHRRRGNSTYSSCTEPVLLVLVHTHLLCRGHGPHGQHGVVAGEGSGSGQSHLRSHSHDSSQHSLVLRRYVSTRSCCRVISWYRSITWVRRLARCCRRIRCASLRKSLRYRDISWSLGHTSLHGCQPPLIVLVLLVGHVLPSSHHTQGGHLCGGQTLALVLDHV